MAINGNILDNSLTTLSSSCREALIDGGTRSCLRLLNRFCLWFLLLNGTLRLMRLERRERLSILRCSIRDFTRPNGNIKCNLAKVNLTDCMPIPAYDLPGST